MKRILMMAAVAMITAMTMNAQRIQVCDSEGQPVPYAHIINDNGDIIGTTNLNGILDDVKGAKVISVSHIAYKPKKVNVERGGRITLEDIEFDLPAITITTKPQVYVQTYYRMFYMNDDPEMPAYYYRGGLLNNYFDNNTRKRSSDEDHFSACNIGILKTLLNTLLSPYIKQFAGLSMNKVEDRMKKKYGKTELSITPDGTDRQRITDKFGVVGSITDNHEKGERRYSYDLHLMQQHLLQITGSDKKIAKAAKREETELNRKDQDFTIYLIDENGNYDPEDFVMSQVATSYDDAKDNSHVNIIMQVFTTKRAYVTKDELKKIKKENKMKMTYENLIQFERSHNIPPLAADLQKHIKEIVK